MSSLYSFAAPAQSERAPATPVDLSRVRRPSYGHYLEEFAAGQRFDHPRGLTLTAAFMQEFATVFHEANPLFLSQEHARALGHPRLPASPLLTLNIALSLGVQNDSEKAIAHLGYYDVRFPRAAYEGDTITSSTRVIGKRERGPGQPGIVEVETTGVNQDGEVLVRYRRKILVPCGGAKARPAAAPAAFQAGGDADEEAARLRLPEPGEEAAGGGEGAWFENFAPGDIIAHPNGRTITQEHFAWTYRVGNTHPLHFDRVYSAALSGAMSGEPIVYGGLVLAWVFGLASRDLTEHAVWELGMTEGYHTAPVVAGDTVYALSRVLVKGPEYEAFGAGAVTFQVIGVKNLTADAAIDQHGADLFMKENDKKDRGKPKIAEKVFEIERTALIRRRGAG
ncbi:MAG: MaoC family dehydratase [Planctomycetes bacterium]|nr:MaoC family dehydratase [Planctomycetota bacterium]